ncbi:aldose epimerase [Dyella sp. C11]|uniref:aldose 1-epimerase n=1 Tax=Dyella sp. C11 TaxID=2126991 RepID=UPI001E3BCB8B|nr:aldose epimerase [Dyella sp. C11]
MAAERDGSVMSFDSAQAALAPGELVHIGSDGLSVAIAPSAGGRVAQIHCDGVEWLVGHDADHRAMIAWGSYPMVPWAGRIRHGKFVFDGDAHALPVNLGAHAIHGVGLAMPWQVDAHGPHEVELSLELPVDTRWPFGGRAHQRFHVSGHVLRMEMSVTAGEHAMPATLGWHPWFHKPDRLDFHPEAIYPRDAEGMATLPTAAPPSGPWDDCFVNVKPVVLHREGQRVRLTSDCHDWVVYDQPTHATCVEPQTAPPDAVNLARARVLAPGETLSAWFVLEWFDS